MKIIIDGELFYEIALTCPSQRQMPFSWPLSHSLNVVHFLPRGGFFPQVQVSVRPFFSADQPPFLVVDLLTFGGARRLFHNFL